MRELAASLVNVTIGSGIFVLPAVIAAILGPASIVAYVTCAIAAGLVALCYAELGSRVATTGPSEAWARGRAPWPLSRPSFRHSVVWPGNMLATPRVLFAFARDGLMPSRLAAIHARYRTPYVAILVYAAIACGLALMGSFRALAVLSVVPTALIYLTCCLATLELRRRDVRADGVPFRTPVGPLVPLAASLVMLWLLTSAGAAELMVVAGILVVASVFYLLRRGGRTHGQNERIVDGALPGRSFQSTWDAVDREI